MLNVVVHFKNGDVIKGTTANFFPQRPLFHLQNMQGASREVEIKDLKAIFFVKSMAGNPDYDESKNFPDRASMGMGKKARVVCADGEELVGFCPAYRKDQQGFFLFPADKESNNDRIFLVTNSVKSVEIL